MPKNYFYRLHKDGSVKEAAFSLSLEELKQYVAIGTLKPTDELQEEGSHEWIQASTMLPEVFSAAKTVDTSPLSSVEVASRFSASTMLHEPFSDEKEAGVAAIASVEVASSLPSPSIQPDKWYYRIRNNGTLDGTPFPVTLEELKTLVSSGKLKPTDELQTDGTQSWVPARWVLPDLFLTTATPQSIQDERAFEAESSRRISNEDSTTEANKRATVRLSLNPCTDCGQMISLRATICPACGAPQDAQEINVKNPTITHQAPSFDDQSHGLDKTPFALHRVLILGVSVSAVAILLLSLLLDDWKIAAALVAILPIYLLIRFSTTVRPIADFFAFRTMIVPHIISTIFVLVCIGFATIGIDMLNKGDNEVLGVIILIVGPLISRLLCEYLVVFFRINNTLTELKNDLRDIRSHDRRE